MQRTFEARQTYVSGASFFTLSSPRLMAFAAALAFVLVSSLAAPRRSFAVDVDAGDRVIPSGSGITEFRGGTMGTTYSVKIHGMPAESVERIRLGIDAELRRVNDEMSTYLKHSEVSRFNRSESTDWFPVSASTAEVVAKAIFVSRRTNGRFDVTVGPLVNAWNFGPEDRSGRIPDSAEVKRLLRGVGFEKLAVRPTPPAIRKTVSSLQIDLSAIAKGHGVDRVVRFLRQEGLKNVFVEIGGEVRAAGSKSGAPWRVGIQRPDAAVNTLQRAQVLRDQAVATSGDYRNFFDSGDNRYSHTIDTRTGRPVVHNTASVSVIATDCMTADAWATALNSMDADEGIEMARENGLSAFVVSRQEGEYQIRGTGEFASASAVVPLSALSVATTESTADGGTGVGSESESSLAASIAPVMLVTLGVFLLVLVGMAVGVIFGRKAISGSCGGLNAQKNEDGSTSCSLCSTPSDACQELRRQVKPSKPKLDPLET